MSSTEMNAPTPDLRIIPVEMLQAHEEHDFQRSIPLIERLKEENTMINPPIVAPMGSSNRFVILDGANRCHAFAALGYPHILVQVVSYESDHVELGTWQHIVCNWDADQFIEHVSHLPDIELVEGQDKHAIAHLLLKNHRVLAVLSPVETIHERNIALQHIVKVYQDHATLQRTALTEPDDVWPVFPTAVAMVVFPLYKPADIIAAAEYHAYLPPGVSRHIVHGRAIRVNFPIDVLRDASVSLERKNADLQNWLHQKLVNRQVRYYAEATYQFDE